MNHTENIVLEQYSRHCLDVQKIGVMLVVLSQYFDNSIFEFENEISVIEKVKELKIIRCMWSLIYKIMLIGGSFIWITMINFYIYTLFVYNNLCLSGEGDIFDRLLGFFVGFSISWIVTVPTYLWFCPIKRIRQIRTGVNRYQSNPNDYEQYGIRCKKRLSLEKDELELINELLEEWLVFTENWTSDAYLDIYNEKRETFFKNEYENDLIVCGIEYEVLVKTGRSILRGNESYDISEYFMVTGEGHAFASERMRTDYPLLYREIMDIDDTLERIVESNNRAVNWNVLDHGVDEDSQEVLCYLLLKEWKQTKESLTKWRIETFFSQESTQDGK